MHRRALVMLLAVLAPARAGSQPVPFGPAFRVNTHTTGLQTYSVPMFDGDGTFLVVWGSSDEDGRGGGIFGQRYDAVGAPVGAEFKVNTHTGLAHHPAVAPDVRGGFAVVWAGQGEDLTPDVYTRRYDVAGVPRDAADLRVNTYTTGRQEEPSIAADAAGRAVVVWNSQDQRGVYAQRFAPDGTAAGGEFQVNTITGAHHRATVASDAGGPVMVVWEVWDADIDVSARRFDDQGAPLGAPFTVNTHTTATQADGFVASGATGEFVVVWSAQLDYFPRLHVAGQRYDGFGAPVGPEFQINIVTTGGLGAPPMATVAAGRDGSFTAVWHWNLDGTRADVVGRHYDATGSPVGGEFAVSAAADRSHEMARASVGPEGDLLVSWTSSPTAPFDGDVYARRFRRDLIFADGFESGSLSAWSFSAVDGGDLSVSPGAAAKLTANGIAAFVDDTAGLYVQDDSPRDELRYRARFYFDPNGFDPGETQGRFRTRLFLLFEENPNRRLAALVLRRQAGNYSLIGRARRDDGSQADLAPVAIADEAHFVELDWRRSTGPDASDGSFEIWIDGASVGTLSNLDNSVSAVDFVRLGALSVKVGATGTLYFDEFDSRRASAIGP